MRTAKKKCTASVAVVVSVVAHLHLSPSLNPTPSLRRRSLTPKVRRRRRLKPRLRPRLRVRNLNPSPKNPMTRRKSPKRRRRISLNPAVTAVRKRIVLNAVNKWRRSLKNLRTARR